MWYNVFCTEDRGENIVDFEVARTKFVILQGGVFWVEQIQFVHRQSEGSSKARDPILHSAGHPFIEEYKIHNYFIHV
jgi:hypothetical protein